ncbi:MAG: glycosyltransferase [Elusimicrobiota bacterium]|nr:hypothetical protein [Endomicrobiia bacterium]MCX7910384.1 hypothetical protein [Endomicrobiia bacterium]MDW8165062.1 glycosyltransferase [Elusimicrobiota bacterium]
MNNKKILILTASYGTGHITAAKSVEAAVNFVYPQFSTKIIDFLFMAKSQNKPTFFQKLYNFSMEKPIIFDIFFTLTNNNFCKFFLKILLLSTNYKIFEKILNEYEPDIIISTHPYWNFLVKRYKKKVKKIPYICIITDSYMIHTAWIDKDVDYYFVIDEDTKHVLINYGVRNIYVTGFPVNPKIFEKIQKEKVLSDLGLEINKKTILITIGLGAVERFLEIINYLRNKNNNFQMIIITGKYKNLYDYLTKLTFNVNTKIIGWTDRMHDFLRVSDVIICKGGGAIVSESLSSGVPVFIPLFVPAQEKGNVYIVKKYKMGFYEEDIEKVYQILDDIIENRINLDEYKENIKKYIKNNPSVIIANLINKILNKVI